MRIIGKHQRVEDIGLDRNNLEMVICRDCNACAHAKDIPTAELDLRTTACAPNCENCKNLRRSSPTRPGVPIGGDCNTRLHICPHDGNHWWQTNSHFHLWSQVTSMNEWALLNRSQEPSFGESYF